MVLISFSPFFLHRDVLNFLRSGDLPPREHVRAVHKEAQYYAIGPLLEQLENMQPLKGEKVRQAFLGLMPYYKGEGSAALHTWEKGLQGIFQLLGLSQKWVGPEFIQIRRKCSPLSVTLGLFKFGKDISRTLPQSSQDSQQIDNISRG